MTQDEIIEMAREVAKQPDRIYAPDEKEFLYYFAKLVALRYEKKIADLENIICQRHWDVLQEREASAKELDEISKEAKNVAPNGYVWKTIKECAEVIRARSSSRGEA